MRMAQFHRHSTGLLHYMHVAYMLYTQVIIRTRSYVRVDVRMQLYIHAHTRLLLSSVVVVHSQKIARSACRIETANFVTYESLVAFFFFISTKDRTGLDALDSNSSSHLTTNFTYITGQNSQQARTYFDFGRVYQSKRCLLIKSSRVTITRDMLFPHHARHFTRLIDAACIVIRVSFPNWIIRIL